MNDKTREFVTTTDAPPLNAPGLVPELPADAFAAAVRAVASSSMTSPAFRTSLSAPLLPSAVRLRAFAAPTKRSRRSKN